MCRCLLAVAITVCIAFWTFKHNEPAVILCALFVLIEIGIWLWASSSADSARILLPSRLSSYALLKGTRRSFGPARFEKPYNKGAAEFEVALGAAKKVEAKAASLLVVLTIMLTTLSSFLKDAPIYIACMVIVFSFPMLALARVFRQLDNIDYAEFGATRRTDADKLRDQFLTDLTYKELCYRFAYHVTLVYLFSAPIIAAAIVMSGVCFER